jgi:signal transduction histidine kinase
VRLDERMPGSGFGLAIVRQMAEGYGGSLRLESARPGLKAVLTLPAG